MAPIVLAVCGIPVSGRLSDARRRSLLDRKLASASAVEATPRFSGSNQANMSLVAHRQPDEVDAGKRTADLLHLAAFDQVAQVDHEEASAFEQRDHLGLRVVVVT
jgi:hypothetical protein